MSQTKTVAKYLLMLITVVCVVGCDRLTKHAATQALARAPTQSYFFDTVRLSYSENAGSFLSLGAKLPSSVRFVLFVVAAGGALIVLVAYAIRRRWSGTRLFGLALFVAGGASNVVDRLADGRVVDFLNVGVGPIRTGIFNVADMALVAGLVLVTLGEYARSRKPHHGAPTA
jgi:signal peptidase II